MEIYAVRSSDGEKFLGLFAARSIVELYDIIDEEDDPEMYEYKLIRQHGGIFNCSNKNLHYSIDDGANIIRTKFQLSEKWDEWLISEMDWKKFPDDIYTLYLDYARDHNPFNSKRKVKCKSP